MDTICHLVRINNLDWLANWCLSLIQQLFSVFVTTRICTIGVMASVLSLNVVSSGFETMSDQMKDCKISMCCISGIKRQETAWVRSRIICRSKVDWCFSELNPTERVGIVQSGHYSLIKFNLFLIELKHCSFHVLQQSLSWLPDTR